jgi:predicted SprT family Zn-dependent metalloprotease
MELTEARRLARDLMHQHGLKDWSFRFDRAKRRFGCCHYATQTITLSRHLTVLNDETTVRDTLLHEIAHALTPDAGHGPAWRAKCLELGAKPEQCFSRRDVTLPVAKYALECRHCGWCHPRYRRSSARYVCVACCRCYNDGRPDKAFVMQWVTMSRR